MNHHIVSGTLLSTLLNLSRVMPRSRKIKGQNKTSCKFLVFAANYVISSHFILSKTKNKLLPPNSDWNWKSEKGLIPRMTMKRGHFWPLKWQNSVHFEDSTWNEQIKCKRYNSCNFPVLCICKLQGETEGRDNCYSTDEIKGNYAKRCWNNNSEQPLS